MGQDASPDPLVLLVDVDSTALAVVQDQLSDDYRILTAPSMDSACAGLRDNPDIDLVVLTVSDRHNNKAAMLRLQEHADDRPIVLVLGFPRSLGVYVPPLGFEPFGVIHKGDHPEHLPLMVREAVSKRQNRMKQ